MLSKNLDIFFGENFKLPTTSVTTIATYRKHKEYLDTEKECAGCFAKGTTPFFCDNRAPPEKNCR